jgi:hypothetical protein
MSRVAHAEAVKPRLPLETILGIPNSNNKHSASSWVQI